jgi:hypothetical protein
MKIIAKIICCFMIAAGLMALPQTGVAESKSSKDIFMAGYQDE